MKGKPVRQGHEFKSTMTKKKQRSEFYTKLWQLTLPMGFQSLMLASVAAADALMLGSVEQNAMSAVSLATQIQFIQNMVIMSIVSVISILGAQYWGKKEIRTVNDILCIGLRSSGLTSILVFLGCMIIPQYLMMIFTNESVLIDIGVQYLRIAGFSYLMTGISQCYLAHLKVTEHASQAALISTVSVIINIVLNAVFILGLFGCPAMGVQGAALATLIARIVELIWSILLSYQKGYHHPSVSQLLHTHRLLEKDFIKVLLPLLGASVFWGVGFTSYSAFMGHLGTDAVAANSIAAVVRDLVCCMCNGIAGAAGIMVGNELGAGDLAKGKLYGDKLMKISFLIGFLSTAIMLALTPLLMLFIKLTPEAKDLMIGMMLIMSVYMIGRSCNSVIINGIFAAGGDTLFDMYSLAVVMWGLAVPLAAAGTFLFHWHPLIVYACTCLDEVGKIPWVMIHYRKYKWVKDLTRSDIDA